MERILTGLRPYTAADLDRLAALVQDARAWPPASPPTPADLLNRWERWHVNPSHDINVLPGPEGELIAYSRASLVTDPTIRIGMEIAVHPEWRGRGIGSALYRMVAERARELDAPHITTPLYLAAGQAEPHSGAGFLEHRGFFPDRSFLQMRLDGLRAQPRAVWPEGISCRVFNGSFSDTETWSALIRGNFHESAVASTVQAQIAEPGSDPAGYFFAVDEKSGREIGTSRARIDMIGGKRVGYVGTVGVLPGYRGRGIATALVLKTLDFLAQRGMESAILYVETSNLTARRLYERMGWWPVYQTVHYWKHLAQRAGASVA